MIGWVDVETTGLDPATGSLLEVGVILTDDNLNELDRVSVLVVPHARYVEELGPDLRLMHAELLREVDAHGFTSSYVEERLAEWLDDHMELGTVMAGNTVGFDRAWLRAHMPAVEARFHYRSIDVSSVKELSARWGFAPKWEGDRKLHRVLPDLEDSIAELRHYREALGA